MAADQTAITPAREPSTPFERIEVCLQLMRKGEWVRGETNHELAERWGVTVRTVEMAACAASAAIRREMPDGELRDEVVARLDDLAHVAASSGDVMPAVVALKAMLEARGLLKQKHEVTHTVQARPTTEIVAAALGNAEFRAALVDAGWSPPKMLVETTGEER